MTKQKVGVISILNWDTVRGWLNNLGDMLEN